MAASAGHLKLRNRMAAPAAPAAPALTGATAKMPPAAPCSSPPVRRASSARPSPTTRPWLGPVGPVETAAPAATVGTASYYQPLVAPYTATAGPAAPAATGA